MLACASLLVNLHFVSLQFAQNQHYYNKLNSELNIPQSVRSIWLFSKNSEIEYLPSYNHYLRKKNLNLNLI